MPRFDMTGPMGRGSMTGRGMGYCARRVAPETGRGGRFGMGIGFGRGSGYGRGLCMSRFGSYGPYAYTEADEAKLLRDEVNYLEEELKAAKEALSKYETQED